MNPSVSNANAGALDCQVGVAFTLTHASDLSEVKRILYEAAATSAYVFTRKPIVVVFRDDFELRHVVRATVKAYVLDNRFENAFASDITERARRELVARGLVPIEANEAR